MRTQSRWRRWFTTVACALLVTPAAGLAQQAATVTGRVTSDAGAPLQGVSVSVAQLGAGSYTGEDGRYSFIVPAARVQGQDVTLSARRLGYQPANATITLAAGTITQDFTLASAPTQLEGIVVTALGIEREKRALGVAAQSVQGEELTAARETNIVNALSGKVSGVHITNAGPQGGSSRIVIRGANSIAGNNQPLFIVDGVPVDNAAPTNDGFGRGSGDGYDYGNAVQDVNPNDIESISVLKGPNAAALYGSRAANGAIIITTKSGRAASGIGLTVTQNVSFETPLRLPDYQNEFGQGSGGQFSFRDGYGNGVNDGTDESWGPPLDGRMIPQFFSNGQPAPWVPAPNNVRDFFETGRTLTTNVALAGQNERANVRLSFTNMDQQGMFPGNELKRINTSLSGGASLTDRLGADGAVHYIRATGDNRPGTGYSPDNAMQQFIWFGRQVDTRLLKNYTNEDGGQFNWNYNYHNNPYWLAHANWNSDQRDRVIGTGSVNYQLTSWLNASARAGTDWYRDFRKRTWAVGTLDFPKGGFEEDEIFRQETNAEFLFTANRDLLSELGMTVNFGGNRRMNTYQFTNEGTSQLVAPGVYNIGNSAIPPVIESFESEKRINSLYGSAQFAYNNYFFVDVTGRNDWSSTLPADNNSYFYPSVSTSLIFTDIVPQLRSNALSYGKLRGSWTKVGNDADPYQLAAVYTAVQPFGNIPLYAVPNTIPNATLKPEETAAWEVGTELRFWDRATLDFTYYDKRTSNQILGAQISGATGFTNIVLNAGEITNKGVELLLDATPVRLANGFEWGVTLNYARNRSQVAELYGDLQTVVLGSYWSMTIEARKGEPYGAFYGNPYLRDSQGRLILNNGRPVVDAQKRVLGNYNPDWTGGVMNTFRYRNVDFSFLFDIKQGGDLYSTSNQWGRYAGVLAETVIGRQDLNGDGQPDGLLIEGVNYRTPAPGCTAGNDCFTDGSANTTRTAAEAYQHSLWRIHEEWIYDASYIKLREMKLGYTVPGNFAARMGLSAMNLSLVGRNLWLSTDVPHIDPETAFSAGNVQGLEFGQLPSARSIGFNITVTP